MQETGEPGIPGVSVTATATISGTPYTFTATTNATGGYNFADLPLGTWTITVDPLTLPGGMTATFDADAVATPHVSIIALTSTHLTDTVQDFGYQGAGSIGNFMWNDLDGDTVQDAGEPGIPGVTVTLTTTIGGSPVTYTTTTGPTGAYSVTGLPLGTYTVAVTPASLPLGMSPSFDADGIGTPDTSTVILTVGTPAVTDQDFGYKGAGSVGDYIWIDRDGDGTQELGEPGLPGVTVTATTVIAGTTITYTTSTDLAGAYLFAGVPLGDYTITTTVTGLTPTFDDDGIATANTSLVTLSVLAPSDVLQDFGYQGGGSIGDLIWNDLDGDGTRDAGEPGIPGVTVNAVVTIGGSPVTFTAVTAADGSYVIGGLPLGTYTVTVDPLTLPGGMTQTGDPDATVNNSSTVTLTVLAPSSLTNDFGYQGAGSIGDLVWNDLDADGVKDANEPGLPGVDITISTTIGGSVVTYTVTTDATGGYVVDGLPLGAYTVTVDPASLPTGVLPVFDLDGGNDHTSAVTLSAGTPVATDQDFGYQGNGSIGDFVWIDLNGDGVQDAGESGLPGVTLTIRSTIKGFSVPYTVTTDANRDRAEG